MISAVATILFQSRGPFLQLFAIYFILCTVPLGLGAYLLFAPQRAGNFLNDAFAIFPQVEAKDILKRLAYRILGIGLIMTSAFYGYQIVGKLVWPIDRYLLSK